MRANGVILQGDCYGKGGTGVRLAKAVAFAIGAVGLALA